jgi:hypothetical protein
MNLIKGFQHGARGKRNSHDIHTMGVLFSIGIFLLLLFNTIGIFDHDSLAQGIKQPIGDESIVTGTGKIFDDNVALARNRAISQAFLKAVEEYLVQTLAIQDIADHFQRLDEEILSKPKEDIQDYQIISELTTDRYVKILMKVRINRAILERKLQSMKIGEINTVSFPVLFLVSEKGEDLSAIYWWTDPAHQTPLTQTELYLSQVFEDKGFRVINRSFFPPQESYDESMLNENLTEEAAVKWGKLLSARIVITGESNLYDQSRASVFLKAVKVADGQAIAQAYKEGILQDNITHDQHAMKLAITKWANEVIPQIIEAARPTQPALNHILVTIKGIEAYKELLQIKEFLRTNISTIQSVLERRLQKDLVKVMVGAKEDSKGLAAALLNHPKKPFLFEINEVSNQGFTLVVK